MKVATAFLAALVAVSAQPVPLPNTYDAFLRIGNIDAQVLLEAHVDLLCPDCAAAEPVLQQVAAHYGAKQLQLVYHLFPLPYHTWAFTAAMGGNVIRSLNSSDAAAAAWVNWMFAGGQQQFWNAALANMTTNQVQSLFASTASQVTGVDASAFLNALQNNDDLNEDTRISWKFGCQRTVTGTPSFFVNGLPVAADSTWTLADWTALLDPLYSNTSSSAAKTKHLLGAVRKSRHEVLATTGRC